MKPIFEKSYDIRQCDVDAFGNLTDDKILFFAQDTAGQHCNLLAVDSPALEEKGLFWAVLRHGVQISRRPREGERITVQTWPMPTTRTAYPRSTVAYDAQGQEVFRAISLWVLMDRQSRAMVLPGKSGVQVQGVLLGSELAVPQGMTLIPAPNFRERRVVFSDLDSNGHVNNCRYLQWVADLLPSGFHRENQAREYSVCYLSEAREGEELLLQWGLSPEGDLWVDALRPEGEMSAGHSRVFSVRMRF